MRAFRQLIAGGALFLFGFAAQAEALRAEWRDAGRNRTVPVKVFAPQGKAAIAFSPNAHERAGPLEQQFGGIHIPVLLLTGTRDGDVVGDGTTPEGRARVYDFLPGPAKVLAIFEGGDHMVFGGHGMRRPATPADRAIQDAVRELSAAFWDAHLRGDARARDWLAGEARLKIGALGQYRAP